MQAYQATWFNVAWYFSVRDGVQARKIASQASWIREVPQLVLGFEVYVLPCTFTACHEKALLRPDAWNTDRIIGIRRDQDRLYTTTHIIVVSGRTDMLWAAFVSSHSELELGKGFHADFVWQHLYM
jgi:hypothetical protein